MRQFYKDIDGAIAFESSAPVGYTLVTGAEKDLLWIAKYEERREDGQRYYTETQASLYLSIFVLFPQCLWFHFSFDFFYLYFKIFKLGSDNNPIFI